MLPFFLALSSGVGAVVNTAKVPMGASVGVVGLAGLDCLLCLERGRGARQIVGIDPVKYKRDGATVIYAV